MIEVPTIAEAFDERFDEMLRLYPERDDYRYLVAGGRLVYAVVVVAQLTDDDSISLFGIEILAATCGGQRRVSEPKALPHFIVVNESSFDHARRCTARQVCP